MAEIADFERRVAPLDSKLRAFYGACNGAKLFRRIDSPFDILPLNGIATGQVAIYGSAPGAPPCPENVFAFCDLQDGNYLGFEVVQGALYPILDLFHESWPERRRVVAWSFDDFLRDALRSGGEHFWLGQPVPPQPVPGR